MGVGNSAGGANANWEGAGVVAGLKSAGRVWVGSLSVRDGLPGKNSHIPAGARRFYILPVRGSSRLKFSTRAGLSHIHNTRFSCIIFATYCVPTNG